MHRHYVIDEVERSLSGLFGKEELKGKGILTGLSGGADSVSLLYALCSLSEKFGFSVSACHINHMIRGEEADRDENFAKTLCEKLGVAFYPGKFNVPEIAKKEKKTLEEAARDVRYSYFEELCDNGIADYIATAHNADDNAETLLFNITRGCGLAGLCSIPQRRGRIIRPLLSVARKDIEDFLGSINADYVTDSTNLVCDCSRNIIRLNVIPELKKINPSFHKVASRLSEIAARESSYLDRIAKENMTEDIKSLAALDPVILSRVIGMFIRERTGNYPSMGHIDKICAYIYESAVKRSGERKLFNLPGNTTVRLECGKLSVKSTFEKPLYREYNFELCEGTTLFCGGRMLAVCTKNPEDFKSLDDTFEYGGIVYGLFMETRLFSGIIKGKILLRSGLSSDRIRISGMSKDIKKMYSAKKIPTDIRKYLPRIVDSGTGEIISLPYTGLCDSQLEYAECADVFVRLYMTSQQGVVSEQ